MAVVELHSDQNGEADDERPIRVLLVDDDEDDFILTRDLLDDSPDSRFEVEWVSDIDRALEEMCSKKHDLF